MTRILGEEGSCSCFTEEETQVSWRQVVQGEVGELEVHSLDNNDNKNNANLALDTYSVCVMCQVLRAPSEVEISFHTGQKGLRV